jgi:cobalt-zinc-cadmium resistance protein CzcA
VALLGAIVGWSLRNRAIVLALTLFLILIGVQSARTLTIDAVPDVTTIQVQILTNAPALSPVEIEQYVTIPIERAMSGVPRSTEIRSISKHGLSVVTVVFREDTDVVLARQLVAERMREAEATVRHGRPELGPISSGLGEIFQFVLRGDGHSPMALEEIMRWQIAPQLRAVPGIVEVNAWGGLEKQYQVVVDPKKLQASGISIAEVVAALEASNANAGGGYLEHEREQVVVGTDGLVRSVDDLSRVVLGTTPQGAPITVATIGEARIGPKLRLGSASMDGKGEVVVGVTLMLTGENAREVTAAVKAKVGELGKALPAGVSIEPFYDRSILVDRTTRTVIRNLAEGAALVIGILLLLLGDLRAGLVVAVTIPLAMLFALTAMKALGLSGNLMSLGAIDFGLIVDGAVIVVENVVRRVDERQAALGRALDPGERSEIVESATLEVRSASAFGELIIAIVYLPIVALVGIEGKLFRPMAYTVLLAIAGAFVLTLTTVPVLASLFVRRPVSQAAHHETWIVRKALALYRPLLDRAIAWRAATIAVAVVGIAGAVLLFSRIGAEFVPQLDEGELLVEARRLPGVGLGQAIELDRRMQSALLEIPEVRHAVSKTGAPTVPTDPMGIEQTDVYLELAPRQEWRPGIDREALANVIDEILDRRVPEVAAFVSQPIQMRTNELVAGSRADVAILIYGRDLALLRELGEKVAAAVREVRGAVDVRVEQVAGLRYLRIVPDRARLARYGLTIDDVNLVTETIAVGREAGAVLEGDRRFGLVVRSGVAFEGDLAPLRSLPLHAPGGRIVPLGDVAELAFSTGPAQVSRKAQARRLGVEFNVRGRDMLSVVEEARSRIGAAVPMPEGHRLEIGGQFEHYLEARARLSFVVPAALFAVFFLLWLATGSVGVAAIVGLGVPFAAIGGVIALVVRGIPFSISAGVGFVALFGVAVLNGLVLVSAAHHHEIEGMSPAVAIRRAAEERLRPVLTTALVASLGFLPMALSTAPGSEVQRPLATVVIGGLVTATILTLFVLPVVYAFRGSPAEER